MTSVGSSKLPKGSWTLHEAQRQLEQKRKLEGERRSKRKRVKVIEIDDDEDNEDPQASNKVKNKTRKPPAKPVKSKQKPEDISIDETTFTGSSLLPSIGNGSLATNEIDPSPTHSRTLRKRLPPIRKAFESDPSFSESSNCKGPRLPKEIPERFSSRLKKRIIQIPDSDSSELDVSSTVSKTKKTKDSSYTDSTSQIKTITTDSANLTPKKAVVIIKAKNNVILNKTTPSKKKTPKAKKSKPARAPKKGGPTKAGAKAPINPGVCITNPTQKKSYTLGAILGKGGFGYIYNVTENTTRTEAVMKIEPHDNGPLFTEIHFYQRACSSDKNFGEFCRNHNLKYLGIPKIMCFGKHVEESQSYRYLVMPKFDTDVQKLFNSHRNKFSTETTILLMIRMLEALQFIHGMGYVHADVKSGNILVKNKNKEVYLADFGLARKYTIGDNHKIYGEDPKKAHDGTPEYTSIDAHRGVPLSRRGDLHILGYCAIEWVGGTLPWKTVSAPDDIRDLKIQWQGKMPDLLEKSLGLKKLLDKPWLALKNYLESVHKLVYDAEPRYHALIDTLRTGLKKKSDPGYMTWS